MSMQRFVCLQQLQKEVTIIPVRGIQATLVSSNYSCSLNKLFSTTPTHMFPGTLAR